ncbi:YdaU family protein [Henriciella sp.]|uniref:YdaU family protein n=1 Tax=Henriciella sp. TaxID=1968823 RepID=UPI002617641D|nr:YdaU family protein [Henriciella sp.]
MAKLPYVPLYLDAFGSAVAHLSLEEEGAYFRLLRLCWETPGCTIPTDPKWIARKLRVNTEEYQNAVVPILKEFFSTRRGRYYQKRLLAEYVKANDKVRARSEAGKAGAAAKHRKTKKKEPDKRSDLPKQTHGIPEPEGSGRTLTGSTMNLPPDGALALERLRAAAVTEHAASEVEGLIGCITAWDDGTFHVTGKYAQDRFSESLSRELRAEGLTLAIGSRKPKADKPSPKFTAIEGGKS